MGDAFGVRGSTIRCRSGLYFDLVRPTPDMVRIDDIAGALSKICRFGAQIDKWYSVAEHSYLACCVGRAMKMDAESQLALLMHDAAEAYIGDVTKPLKLLLDDYDTIEIKVSSAINQKFGIDMLGRRDKIKVIDQALLIFERNQLFGRDGEEWAGERDAIDISDICPAIVNYDHWSAEVLFANTFRNLMVECGRSP